MATYHLELRHFPRSYNHFNLTGPEIGAIAMTWAQERLLDLGDQKWSPAQTKMKIIEGPEIPVDRLSMGRGWQIATREGEDVTDRILAEARRALAQAAAPAGPPAGSAAAQESDGLALGVELGGLLGAEPGRLLAAWRAVAGRSAGLTPSESLALAERELASGSPPGG